MMRHAAGFSLLAILVTTILVNVAGITGASFYD
jgi:hypothetical protein